MFLKVSQSKDSTLETLEKENNFFKKKYLEFKSSIPKFSKKNEALEKLLISQRSPSLA